MHEGIDLAAPRGTPVVATAAGTVVFAGRSSGRYGKIVVIDHGNGYQTRYAHLQRVLLRKGEKVRRGQPVGRVGRSGNATGCHLHYEVRLSAVALDPAPFLD
jgi:murein DD-endopeptidase MepM/ murein hydrolase activator NlpD